MNETQPEISNKPSRKVRLLLFLLSPKVAIPLMILLALLSAPFMYRMHRINMLPDIGDPFDVQAFGTVEITDEENAFVEYRAATKLLVELKMTSTSYDELHKALDEGWSAASEDIRKWLEDNRPAMELWRKGTEKPDALYVQPKDSDWVTSSPAVQPRRQLARLAQIEGSRLEQIGKPEEAWDWYRAIYRYSCHCGRHGTTLEKLVGIAFQSISSTSIEKWSRDQRVSEIHLKQAIDHLKTDYRMTALTSDVLKVEYLSLKNTILLETGQYVLDESDFPLPLGTSTLYFLGDPELSFRVMQHVWKNQLAEIDKPLHQRSRRSSCTLELFELNTLAVQDTLQPSLEVIDEAFRSSIYAKKLLVSSIMGLDGAIWSEQLSPDFPDKN